MAAPRSVRVSRDVRPVAPNVSGPVVEVMLVTVLAENVPVPVINNVVPLLPVTLIVEPASVLLPVNVNALVLRFSVPVAVTLPPVVMEEASAVLALIVMLLPVDAARVTLPVLMSLMKALPVVLVDKVAALVTINWLVWPILPLPEARTRFAALIVGVPWKISVILPEPLAPRVTVPPEASISPASSIPALEPEPPSRVTFGAVMPDVPTTITPPLPLSVTLNKPPAPVAEPVTVAALALVSCR